MTMQYGACSFHAGNLRQEYRHNPIICSIYCFTTETMLTRTRRSVTLHVHCLSLCSTVNTDRYCKVTDKHMNGERKQKIVFR